MLCKGLSGSRGFGLTVTDAVFKSLLIRKGGPGNHFPGSLKCFFNVECYQPINHPIPFHQGFAAGTFQPATPGFWIVWDWRNGGDRLFVFLV